MQSEAPSTPWERLRAPFPPDRVGVLPRPTRRDNPKGRCEECGGWHGLPAVHLDYIGHADVTDRLLSVDPQWSWEPVAWGDDGLPRLVRDEHGTPIGLWIRLTVCGFTRLGYGSVEGGAEEAEKQLISDALRNAAMRFGVGLDLWRRDETKRSHVEAEAAAPAVDPQDDMGPCDESGCDGRLRAKTVTARGREVRIVECTRRRFAGRGSCDRKTDWAPDWAWYEAHRRRAAGEPVEDDDREIPWHAAPAREGVRDGAAPQTTDDDAEWRAALVRVLDEDLTPAQRSLLVHHYGGGRKLPAEFVATLSRDQAEAVRDGAVRMLSGRAL